MTGRELPEIKGAGSPRGIPDTLSLSSHITTPLIGHHAFVHNTVHDATLVQSRAAQASALRMPGMFLRNVRSRIEIRRPELLIQLRRWQREILQEWSRHRYALWKIHCFRVADAGNVSKDVPFPDRDTGLNFRSFRSSIAARNSSEVISPSICLWKIRFASSSISSPSSRRFVTAYYP